MDEFLKMDIFFAVTTVVVLLGGVFCVVALFYFIKILRSVDNVARNVSEESNSIRGDIGILRTKIRDEGMKLKHFSDFFGGISSRRQQHKKTKVKESH